MSFGLLLLTLCVIPCIGSDSKNREKLVSPQTVKEVSVFERPYMNDVTEIDFYAHPDVFHKIEVSADTQLSDIVEYMVEALQDYKPHVCNDLFVSKDDTQLGESVTQKYKDGTIQSLMTALECNSPGKLHFTYTVKKQ